MKGKILSLLKTKYKDCGFREEAFIGVADYLSKTVTEEKDIETAVSGVENLLRLFQGEVDVVRTEKSLIQKKLEELEKKAKEADETGGGSGEQGTHAGNEEATKALTGKIEALVARLEKIESGREQEKRMSGIFTKIESYGIPDFYAKRYAESHPIGTTDEETYLNEMKSDFEDIKQGFVNNGFKESKKPHASEDNKGSEEDELVSQIQEGTKKIVEQKKD